MAIPSVFDPIQIEGKMYVDGGLVDNFPVIEMIRRYFFKKCRNFSFYRISININHINCFSQLRIIFDDIIYTYIFYTN